jgi:hypothetical protein
LQQYFDSYFQKLERFHKKNDVSSKEMNLNPSNLEEKRPKSKDRKNRKHSMKYDQVLEFMN